MKLDRDICLGGRFNKKRVLGIKINNHIIFPNIKYNHYVLEIPEGGGAVLFDRDAYLKTSTEIEEYIDGPGGELKTVSNASTRYQAVPIYEYKTGGTYELITSYFIIPCFLTYYPPVGAKCVKEVKAVRSDLIHAGDLFGEFGGGEYGLTISMECLPPELTNADFMFNGCYSKIIDISHLDFSGITSMAFMFNYCSTSEIYLNKSFITESVTDIGAMFQNCNNLTTINGIEYFNTSNVTNMNYMFSNCLSLTELDLSNWDTSNVDFMIEMFSYCESLTELNLSNWDTSNVDFMIDMFTGCNSLHTLRLDNWNKDTINKIITSEGFPTNTISGKTRTIYCKRANAQGLTPPTNWVFSYVD